MAKYCGRRHDARAMPRASAKAERPERFGPAYYDRFYRDPRTRVSDARAIDRLAGFVAGYLRHLDVDVRSILDVGCGLGHWRTAARTHFPRARWHGVEFSQHLCDEHGWTQGSIVDLDPERAFGQARFDLVVCQGVLQYLDDKQAARALGNLAQWCGKALYLEALTTRDWQENCDRTRTDGDVHLRSGAFYRRRLQRHFTALGGGLFARDDAGITLFELEAP